MAPRDLLVRLTLDEEPLTLEREQRRELLRKLERMEELEWGFAGPERRTGGSRKRSDDSKNRSVDFEPRPPF